MPLSAIVSVLASLLKLTRTSRFGSVVQRFITQLVAGVRGVGDQLTHENLFVGVQRVGDEVQQLGYFGLEGQGLLGHEGQLFVKSVDIGL